MTPAETAEKIACMLRGMGLDARVHDFQQSGEQCVTVDVLAMEEPVAEMNATTPGDVRFLPLRLGIHCKALRAKKIANTNERDIERRCAEIAERVRGYLATKDAQGKAWAVVDELKSLGMPATARGGRVVITLDLSPEYAAKVGPKIAAVMGEKEATA